MEVNNTMYGNNEGVPGKLLDISCWVVQESEIISISKWEPLILCSYSLIKPSLSNRNSSSTIVQPYRFNILCSQCLQCQLFMTNLELDRIESILMITSQIISKHMKRVMWYNKKRNLQHHNSLKRITFNWWQWGILNLFAQNQMKGNFLFNVCVCWLVLRVEGAASNTKAYKILLDVPPPPLGIWLLLLKLN